VNYPVIPFHVAPQRLKSTALPMPISSAAASLPVLATVLADVAAFIVIFCQDSATSIAAITIDQPSPQDAYAIVGAILASTIALIEARYKGRDFAPAVSNFLACASIGSFAPAIAYHWAASADWIQSTTRWAHTWQAWAAAGFVAGMNGWWLIHHATAVLKDWIPAKRHSRRR
jgi:hypothetical protein